MIIWKPNGSLDVSTDPSDLPAEQAGKNTISFAMQRCKNLRLENTGYAQTRHGSTKLNDTPISGTPQFIFEVDGYRYVFTSDGLVYRNETALLGGRCEPPVLSPAGGEYSATQTVTMTTTTVGAQIYYTMDGSEPTESSLLYSGSILVELFTQIRAIAVREGFVDSTITNAYYSASTGYLYTETNADTIVTETNADNIINEGDS